MASLVERTGTGLLWTTMLAPVAFGVGYGFGYVYANLAAMSVQQAAKAYAINALACFCINNMVTHLTSEMEGGSYILLATTILVNATAIYDMRTRGFMGNKLLMLSLAFLTCEIFNALFGLCLIRQLSQLNSPKTI